MKIRRFRWLLIFFLALFTVNNVAAAARACTLSEVRHQHASNHVQAKADPSCPEAVATPCASHCVLEAKSGEQKATWDCPQATIAPLFAFVYETFRPEPVRLPLASSFLIVGPPLTILFGNLRI